MNSQKICIFCGKEISKRKKGDHIISQGLGAFLPECSIYTICNACDSNHGDHFERIFLQTGLVAFIRSIKNIKSNNNKKRSPHNPSFDKFNAIESKYFSIKDAKNAKNSLYIAREGKVASANAIRILRGEHVIDIIEIPITENIREICNFIEAKLSEKNIDLEYQLNLSSECIDDVANELARRGLKLGNTETLQQPPIWKTACISSIITGNHFKYISYTILKAMLYLSYPEDFLENIVKYIRDDDSSNVNMAIDAHGSGINAFDDPPLREFYHKFSWKIQGDWIMMSACIFAHRNVNGIKFDINFKAGNTKRIIKPYGHILARYNDMPEKGILEIFDGDKNVFV